MGVIAIRSPRDAAIWRMVDRCFAGEDPRRAIADLELELIRSQAAYWSASGDWLIDLMRDTDPARLGSKDQRAA